MPKQNCENAASQPQDPQCRTVPREQCQEVPTQKCETVSVKYNNSLKNLLYLQMNIHFQVPQQSCQSVPKQVEERVCQNIPRQQCQQVKYISMINFVFLDNYEI